MSVFVLSGAVVAGIVLGSILLLLLLFLAGRFCYIRFFKVSPQSERVPTEPEAIREFGTRRTKLAITGRESSSCEV